MKCKSYCNCIALGESSWPALLFPVQLVHKYPDVPVSKITQYMRSPPCITFTHHASSTHSKQTQNDFTAFQVLKTASLAQTQESHRIGQNLSTFPHPLLTTSSLGLLRQAWFGLSLYDPMSSACLPYVAALVTLLQQQLFPPF